MRHWLDTEKNQTGQVDKNEFKDLRIKSFPLTRLTKIKNSISFKIVNSSSIKIEEERISK
jgi:hypothetical protein